MFLEMGRAKNDKEKVVIKPNLKDLEFYRTNKIFNHSFKNYNKLFLIKSTIINYKTMEKSGNRSSDGNAPRNQRFTFIVFFQISPFIHRFPLFSPLYRFFYPLLSFFCITLSFPQ